MFKLRDYQNDTLNDARKALSKHMAILIVSPTGSGKTVLTSEMVGNASAKGKRAYFGCHRVELVDQTAQAFDEMGLTYGFIANGYKSNPFEQIQICSIGTLKARKEKYPKPDVMFWDECHHLAAKGWSEIRYYYSDARHIGLTATPIRLDGKGLNGLFSALVEGPTVKWLIDNGYLSDYKIFAPSTPDMNGIHRSMGDFNKKELAELMDRNTLIGNSIHHYNKYAGGTQAVAFCVNVLHSEHTAQQFRESGIMALHIDGKMNRQARRDAIQAFRDGHVKVLCNVDIVGEGFDLPALETAILMRPTQSLALFLQQVGRCLRPAPGKSHAIILDHAGNVLRHGFPDDERKWSLEGTSRGNKVATENKEKIKQCPVCFHVHRPAPACPLCQHVYLVSTSVPQEGEGELIEMSRENQTIITKKMAETTISGLVGYGIKKGISNPYNWAAKEYAKIQAKKL